MDFRLARDQDVLLETAANLWDNRRKANYFLAVFFFFFFASVELGGVTKHLMTGPAGNSEFCFPQHNHWGSRGDKTHCFPRDQSISAYCFSQENNPLMLFESFKYRLIWFYADAWWLNSWNFVPDDPGSSFGIFGHVTCLDQSRASKNTWWIIMACIVTHSWRWRFLLINRRSNFMKYYTSYEQRIFFDNI